MKQDATPSPASTPYRTAAPAGQRDPDALDERPVLWFLVCVGALRAGAVVVRGEAWDTGAVVLALLMGAAGWELYALARREPPRPRP